MKICFVLILAITWYVSSGQALPQPDTAFKNIKAGVWSDATVWSGSIFPGDNDSVVLMYDLVIDVDTRCRALNQNGFALTINPGVKLSIEGVTTLVNSNAVLIDTGKLKLVSTPEQLGTGMYRYLIKDGAPSLKVNSVITGFDSEPYLRKVNSVSKVGDTLEVGTTQGNLTDLFTDVSIGHNMGVNGLQQNAPPGQGVPAEILSGGSNSIDLPISETEIEQEYDIDFKLKSGNLSFTPNFKFDYEYRKSKLQSFEMLCRNAIFSGQLRFGLKLSGEITETETTNLYSGSKYLAWLAAGWPVWVKLEFDVDLISEITGKAEVEQEFIYTFSKDITAGLVYAPGSGWSAPFTLNNGSDEISLPAVSGSAEVSLKLSLEPKFTIKLYSVVGPYISFGAFAEGKGTASMQAPSLDWDFQLNAGAEVKIGCNAGILDEEIPLFEEVSWPFPIVTGRTPYQLQKFSGDKQASIDTDNYLPEPIRVRVLDSKGLPQQKVNVYFEITQGNGQLLFENRFTDANGYAETSWKIDNTPQQKLIATARYGDGEAIVGAPVEFNATYGVDSVKVVQIFNQGNVPSFSGNVFKTIGVGRHGAVWAGTATQGLYQYNESAWRKWSYPLNAGVNYQDIKPDQNGRIWIAQSGVNGSQSTNGGIICFPDSSLTNYQVYTPLGSGLPTRNVRGIFIDVTRYQDPVAQLPVLWTANYATTSPSLSGAVGRGVSSSAPNFTKITKNIDSTNNSGGVFYIGGDQQEIWAYASNNYEQSQILRYNAVNNSFLGYYDATNVLNGLFSNNFFARGIYFDALGNRWITISGEGVGVRVATGQWTKASFGDIFNSTTNYNPNAIAGNQRGDVYFGTNNGLVVYRGGYPPGQYSSYKKFTTADGLPSNNILAICVDESRELVWIATDNGIALWNPPFDGK